MITREFLAGFNFRIMTRNDLLCFSGCESPVPLIAENDQYLVIIDGSVCEVYGEDASAGPLATCDDIVALPYSSNPNPYQR
jgi:hypothetical protein